MFGIYLKEVELIKVEMFFFCGDCWLVMGVIRREIYGKVRRNVLRYKTIVFR